MNTCLFSFVIAKHIDLFRVEGFLIDVNQFFTSLLVMGTHWINGCLYVSANAVILWSVEAEANIVLLDLELLTDQSFFALVS